MWQAGSGPRSAPGMPTFEGFRLRRPSPVPTRRSCTPPAPSSEARSPQVQHWRRCRSPSSWSGWRPAPAGRSHRPAPRPPRRFLTGTGSGVLVGLLASLAVVLGSFWLYRAAMFFGGAYAAVVLSFRYAAADCVPAARRPRALATVMAGGGRRGHRSPARHLHHGPVAALSARGEGCEFSPFLHDRLLFLIEGAGPSCKRPTRDGRETCLDTD